MSGLVSFPFGTVMTRKSPKSPASEIGGGAGTGVESIGLALPGERMELAPIGDKFGGD